MKFEFFIPKRSFSDRLRPLSDNQLKTILANRAGDPGLMHKTAAQGYIRIIYGLKCSSTSLRSFANSMYESGNEARREAMLADIAALEKWIA